MGDPLRDFAEACRAELRALAHDHPEKAPRDKCVENSVE
jgi:hypothetical protein